MLSLPTPAPGEVMIRSFVPVAPVPVVKLKALEARPVAVITSSAVKWVIKTLVAVAALSVKLNFPEAASSVTGVGLLAGPRRST